MRKEVKEGYEKGDYEGDYREDRIIQKQEEKFFEKISDIVEGKKVLDLGCGTGVPFDTYLRKQGYDLTGVDIADKHIEKARENLPEAEFIQGDFFEQDFEQNSFDVVVSFYAIFHIPREEHERLFTRIRKWVDDNGLILVTLGSSEMDNYEDEIGGQKMVWSSYSVDKNKEIVEKAGFNIIETYIEDWREESHLWVLAEPKKANKKD